MWTNYNVSHPGKLHIVAANIQTQTSEQINGSTWRTKFDPDLTYFLATKSMLGNTYSQFGNGYVPYNVVIGGGNRVLYSSTDIPPNSVIEQAIMSLDIYPNSSVPSQLQLDLGQTLSIDLSNFFSATNGLPVNCAIDSLPNSALLNATVSNNILTLTGGNSIGTTKLRIKAYAGDLTGYHTITINLVEHNQTILMNEGFEDPFLDLPTGWSNIGSSNYNRWYSGSNGYNNRCAIAFGMISGSSILTTPQYTLPDADSIKFSFYWKNNDVIKIERYDTTYCEISEDAGSSWNTLAFLSANEPQENFVKKSIMLNNYQNKTISLRWRFVSDGSSSAYGVGLDEALLCYYKGTDIDNNAVENKSLSLQNYPNPFNPETAIRFITAENGEVKLSVYNSMGELVATLVNGNLQAGLHSYKFNASSLTSGVYFYQLQFNGKTTGGNRMLLLK